jgi:hypothetical protein
MEPYRERDPDADDDDAPHTAPNTVQRIKWDYCMVGGRYGGQLKLYADESSGGKYAFGSLMGPLRAGSLFRCRLLEEIQNPLLHENDMLRYMGMRDGYILVDGAWLPDVINREEIADMCAAIIVDNQQVIVRRLCEEDFDDIAKDTMRQMAPDHYLTVIDCHAFVTYWFQIASSMMEV